MKYIVLSDSAVDDKTRVEAHKALAFARKELRLPMIEIKWFVSQRNAAAYAEGQKIGSFENNYDNIAGTYRNDEPWTIYIDPTTGALSKAVLHETYHALQFNKCFGASDEATAKKYGEEAFNRLFMQGVDDNTYFAHLAGENWSETKELSRK